jgi:acyl-coenzyme A synthetase/AMP-(fatty) acid ligase
VLNSRVIESWGNSESLGTITDPDDLERRPGSIGRPFLTDELYIVDDNLEVQGPHTYGRIAGNEEAGFFQYSNRPDETNRVKQRSLIVSEDIGYMDDDGYFYVRGRQQDCIVIEDTTLFLPDIEQRIRQNPRIEECSIAANELNEISIELVAVILPSEEMKITEQELLQELNGLLDMKEQLARLLILSSMPRVPSGKIDKVAIAQLVKEGR